MEPVLLPDLLPGDGFLCGVLLHSAHAVLDASRGQESPGSEQLEAAVRPAETGIALSFLRPASPMVRPLSLLRRPAERHDPHDESAGSGARPAFSPAQGAAPLQVRLRRTRTHPPCTRRRDLLFRKRLALTAGLPHIERRRVQRLHPCSRNRPPGDVRLLGREVVARLLELDIDTRRCRATRMQNVDPWSVLLPFGEDWVLVKGACDSMRLDFARLWNRTTGEVLRIRPGMFGSEKLEHIGRLSDSRVVLTTLRSHVGQVVHFPADFWNFLRSASRPQTLEPMQPCEALYPDIPLTQPE